MDCSLSIHGVTIKINTPIEAYIIPITGIAYKIIKVKLIVTDSGDITAVSSSNSQSSFNLRNLVFSKEVVKQILEQRAKEEAEAIQAKCEEALRVSEWKLRTTLSDLESDVEQPSFEVGT